jgi:hypothetical protein
MRKDLFDNIVAALLPEMSDANERKALIEGALHGSPVLKKIQWDGPADAFTKRLARQLDEFGQIEPGKPAIVALLEEVKQQVGADRQERIDILLSQIMTPIAKPSSPEKIPPHSKTSGEMEKAMFTNGHALLIGVGADLPVTVSDAAALRDLLIATDRAAYPSEQVELLTEAKADRNNILDAFDRLIERVKKNPDATVIVYYSGHGGRIERIGKPTEYFLIPHGYNPAQWNKTAISGKEFTEKIEALGARKIVVLLDCCHAGGLPAVKSVEEKFVKSPLPPELIARLDAGSGWVIVASSREDEFSYIGNPYSVFTACLLEAMQGKGATTLDGHARILDVLVYLFAQVPRRASGPQHPLIKKVLDLGENFPLCFYAGGSKNLPAGQAVAAAEPRVDYRNWKRRQLEQKRDGLRAEWELLNKKVSRFRRELAIEAGLAVRFQLEEQLLQEEARLAQLNETLEEIERALSGV